MVHQESNMLSNEKPLGTTEGLFGMHARGTLNSMLNHETTKGTSQTKPSDMSSLAYQLDLDGANECYETRDETTPFREVEGLRDFSRSNDEEKNTSNIKKRVSWFPFQPPTHKTQDMKIIKPDNHVQHADGRTATDGSSFDSSITSKGSHDDFFLSQAFGAFDSILLSDIHDLEGNEDAEEDDDTINKLGEMIQKNGQLSVIPEMDEDTVSTSVAPTNKGIHPVSHLLGGIAGPLFTDATKPYKRELLPSPAERELPLSEDNHGVPTTSPRDIIDGKNCKNGVGSSSSNLFKSTSAHSGFWRRQPHAKVDSIGPLKDLRSDARAGIHDDGAIDSVEQCEAPSTKSQVHVFDARSESDSVGTASTANNSYSPSVVVPPNVKTTEAQSIRLFSLLPQWIHDEDTGTDCPQSNQDPESDHGAPPGTPSSAMAVKPNGECTRAEDTSKAKSERRPSEKVENSIRKFPSLPFTLAKPNNHGYETTIVEENHGIEILPSASLDSTKDFFKSIFQRVDDTEKRKPFSNTPKSEKRKNQDTVTVNSSRIPWLQRSKPKHREVLTQNVEVGVELVSLPLPRNIIGERHGDSKPADSNLDSASVQSPEAAKEQSSVMLKELRVKSAPVVHPGMINQPIVAALLKREKVDQKVAVPSEHWLSTPALMSSSVAIWMRNTFQVESEFCEHCKENFQFMDARCYEYVASPRCHVKGNFHPACFKARQETMKEMHKALRCILVFGRLRRLHAKKAIMQRRETSNASPPHYTLFGSFVYGLMRRKKDVLPPRAPTKLAISLNTSTNGRPIEGRGQVTVGAQTQKQENALSETSDDDDVRQARKARPKHVTKGEGSCSSQQSNALLPRASTKELQRRDNLEHVRHEKRQKQDSVHAVKYEEISSTERGRAKPHPTKKLNFARGAKFAWLAVTNARRKETPKTISSPLFGRQKLNAQSTFCKKEHSHSHSHSQTTGIQPISNRPRGRSRSPQAKSAKPARDKSPVDSRANTADSLPRRLNRSLPHIQARTAKGAQDKSPVASRTKSVYSSPRSRSGSRPPPQSSTAKAARNKQPVVSKPKRVDSPPRPRRRSRSTPHAQTAKAVRDKSPVAPRINRAHSPSRLRNKSRSPPPGRQKSAASDRRTSSSDVSQRSAFFRRKPKLNSRPLSPPRKSSRKDALSHSLLASRENHGRFETQTRVASPAKRPSWSTKQSQARKSWPHHRG